MRASNPRWRWPAVACTVAAIFAASSVPAKRAPAVPRAIPATAIPTDKAAHVVEFAALAFLIASALRNDGPNAMRPATAAAAAAIAGTAFGMLDELHQRSVTGREAAWDDVAADALGSAAGAAVAAMAGARDARRCPDAGPGA